MAKEYKWMLPVGDAEKEISCEVDGNKYHLYIGDAFVKTYYKATTGETDEAVELCGVPCRFVAFNEKPDIVVDGKLLSNGKSYEEARNKRSKFNKSFAISELAVGIFSLAAFVIWMIVKNTFSTHFVFLILPLAFILFGIYELCQLSKKEKEVLAETKKEEPLPSESSEEG